ncbi:hypothetical protein [Methylobacterium gnaphalii]|uniref:Uncharacterized protein n=1 Tax=Methylobacterium gnaphalii TaxID=1010610 RepID=A0A512JQN8_9HYPH|nr:hypothetical protein [Methylobacterium gnaphalii]GEP12252.1 hypothetical protein MGN01_40970 [Methylobacterium gnaphalii]GJD68744.1 hypothetical protein MMMDOFMJ_1668 [Methylobacterium gnaphalii]GLS49359.1 hypothetical protein GCM10007885_22070 [Methylobacterium gnaphalii]
MAFLSNTQRAAAQGATVIAALLVSFDFTDAPAFYWTGDGPLKTADGQIWDGTSGLGQVDGLSAPVGTSAPQATFTLSGVSARVAALARQQSALVKGREVRVSVQFCAEDLALLDAPVEVYSGSLDVMTYQALGSGIFSVQTTAESPWTGRNKPPFGFLTDADQQARYPGDRGLELVAGLVAKTILWPS